tara:strand:+ start:911 stop:1339 length:429 start_codon:yes stop_codon:yes gene_type:complete
MKKIKIIPINIYSCQFCGRDFETTKEYIITPEHSPICSNLCLFRFIYKILKDYDKETLYFIGKELNIIKKDMYTQKELSYNLTKHYVKMGLSSINKEAQCSSSNKQAQHHEHKQAHTQHILYNRMLSLSAEPKLNGVSSNVR